MFKINWVKDTHNIKLKKPNLRDSNDTNQNEKSLDLSQLQSKSYKQNTNL